jgi:hypothetical protein
MRRIMVAVRQQGEARAPARRLTIDGAPTVVRRRHVASFVWKLFLLKTAVCY